MDYYVLLAGGLVGSLVTLFWSRHAGPAKWMLYRSLFGAGFGVAVGLIIAGLLR